MAYEEPTTPVTGTPISSANFGIKVVNSLKAIWAGTAAGDIDYYDSATTKAKLAKPSIDSLLQNTSAGVPSWLSLASLLVPTKRIGGSSTNFGSGGSTNYDITGNIGIDMGVSKVTISSAVSGNVSVAFQIDFTYTPILVIGIAEDSARGSAVPPVVRDDYFTSLSKDGVTITAIFDKSVSGSVSYPWIAIGPIA